MGRFENKQGITSITFTQNIQCFCPLGDDWYTNEVEVTFVPEDVIPDYCEIDDYTRSLAGKALIIEDVVNDIFNYMMTEYAPSELCVTSVARDAKHMPVEVTKEL